MRTLKTEVGRIPLGATHYSDEEEGGYFCWYKIEGGVGYVMPMGGIGFRRKWYECEHGEHLQPCVKRISPVAATETPEEKEALDNIKVTKVDDKQSVKIETEHQKEMAEFGVEWKNGDECVISSKSKSKWFVVGVSPVTKTSTICISETCELKSFHTNQLKKPEPPEDKEERERLESAYDLYESAQHEIGCIGYDSFELFKKSKVQVKFWLAIVDKTKYRKGVK